MKPYWTKAQQDAWIASTEKPYRPPNGDHISLTEILAAYDRADQAYGDSSLASDILCDSHRGVDVHHALAREADRRTIIPTLKDEKDNIVVRFRPA